MKTSQMIFITFTALISSVSFAEPTAADSKRGSLARECQERLERRSQRIKDAGFGDLLESWTKVDKDDIDSCVERSCESSFQRIASPGQDEHSRPSFDPLERRYVSTCKYLQSDDPNLIKQVLLRESEQDISPSDHAAIGELLQIVREPMTFKEWWGAHPVNKAFSKLSGKSRR